jgi:hypothetical protein
MEVTLISSEDLKKIQSDIAALRENSDEWIEDKVAVKLLGIHTKTLYRYRRMGLLPYSKAGRKVYYRKRDIANYLARFYNDLIENYKWDGENKQKEEQP